ncbi:hypothetical protein BaRGS_00031927, partial [Batillaria attramentaria]
TQSQASMGTVAVTIAVWYLALTQISVEGAQITCEAPPVTEGSTASLTCNFGEDLSMTRRAFNVRRLKSVDILQNTVLDCRWNRTTPICSPIKDGYDFNLKVTDRLTLMIPNVTSEFAGKYVCQAVPSEPQDLTECLLVVIGTLPKSDSSVAAGVAVPLVLLFLGLGAAGGGIFFCKKKEKLCFRKKRRSFIVFRKSRGDTLDIMERLKGYPASDPVEDTHMLDDDQDKHDSTYELDDIDEGLSASTTKSSPKAARNDTGHRPIDDHRRPSSKSGHSQDTSDTDEKPVFYNEDDNSQKKGSTDSENDDISDRNYKVMYDEPRKEDLQSGASRLSNNFDKDVGEMGLLDEILNHTGGNANTAREGSNPREASEAENTSGHSSMGSQGGGEEPELFTCEHMRSSQDNICSVCKVSIL